MASTKQTQAARRNVKRPSRRRRDRKPLPICQKDPDRPRQAGCRGGPAAAYGLKRPQDSRRAYELAQAARSSGRSKMGRDELARQLGEK